MATNLSYYMRFSCTEKGQIKNQSLQIRFYKDKENTLLFTNKS